MQTIYTYIYIYIYRERERERERERGNVMRNQSTIDTYFKRKNV